MGVTNGFLRMPRAAWERLSTDRGAFARTIETSYSSPDYLDMDKAGFELALLLDPSLVDPDFATSWKNPFPHITGLLAGGADVFPEFDVGYGPAALLDDADLRGSLAEFPRLDFESLAARLKNDIIAELLPGDLTHEELREYHWNYLQTLGDFVRNAVSRDCVVLRY